MFWNTADEIMEKDPDLAIIPVGSLEQHGPHLPVMTDWAIAFELGKRVAKRMGAFLVPALPISTCREQMGKKGSVWSRYRMLKDLQKEVVRFDLKYTIDEETVRTVITEKIPHLPNEAKDATIARQDGKFVITDVVEYLFII